MGAKKMHKILMKNRDNFFFDFFKKRVKKGVKNAF
jgi:hypothetical protein